MKDIQLTPHFMLSEFTRSSTATARHIDNTPNEEHIANLRYLCEQILEPLRQHFNTPVLISSGYRCPELNKAVGGSKTSNHTYGYAADLQIPYRVVTDGSKVQDVETGKRWFTWIMDNCQFDELIWEHSTPTSNDYWIHVAIRRNVSNRQKVVTNLVKNQTNSS